LTLDVARSAEAIDFILNYIENLARLLRKPSFSICAPRQLEPSISLLTEQIILSGLKIRAEERFQTADEIIQALSVFTVPSSRKKRKRSQIPDWVSQRIQEAKQNQLEVLDLRLLNPPPRRTKPLNGASSRWSLPRLEPLKVIPTEIFELANLRVLLLGSNQIREIPKSIIKLDNLMELDLSNNQISYIPDSILQMKSLLKLDLSHNKIDAFSAKIFISSQIEELNLGFNMLNHLPEFTNEQENLASLNLEHNKLIDLPDTIAKLSGLKLLNLAQNNFEKIPGQIYNIKSLTEIDLSAHSVSITDCSMCGASKLPHLEFCDECGYSFYEDTNCIHEISSDIVNLDNLSILNLDGNPINEPPPEVAQLGTQAIRRYFLQLRSEGEASLHEAKLLIIGEAGAGKTSLAKKIIDLNYRLSPDEESTEGIDVRRKIFRLETQDFFRLNVWDFGGQEIYHATHQFFLTKRSLYILVADTRKEDTDFDYWLNIASLLSDNSPLLILQNEKQDRKRDINEPILQSQFSNFKETLSTNLLTNRGLGQAIESIKYYIRKLPHFGATIPKTWVTVRKVIERDARNYISLDEYFIICEQSGFTQREDKLQLSRYLHDIGVFLHFQDDDLLAKTLILDPNWGTSAVYRVLDNEIVRENRGQFTRSDITQIWSDETYASMQGELLRLMCKFQLCYEISTSPGTYIAPQLLSEKQPEYEWDNSSNFILRYTYEFMPKGILTRFIVILHELIYEQKHVWKSGVILSQDETKAEVIEYYSKREIKIRVSGTHKRDLMIIIIHELDKIHDSYKNLKFKKMVPCNCFKCNESQTPHFYDFKKLRERKALNKLTIECGNPPFIEVNVESLMEGIMPVKQFSSQGQQRLQEEINSLQEAYDVLSKKLQRLRLDLASESGSSASFKLEKEIQQVQQDRASVELQLQELEQKIFHFSEQFNHPAISIPIETIKGWVETE
jgi:internalin A